jgi:hypothetical protein
LIAIINYKLQITTTKIRKFHLFRPSSTLGAFGLSYKPESSTTSKSALVRPVPPTTLGVSDVISAAASINMANYNDTMSIVYRSVARQARLVKRRQWFDHFQTYSMMLSVQAQLLASHRFPE